MLSPFDHNFFINQDLQHPFHVNILKKMLSLSLNELLNKFAMISSQSGVIQKILFVLSS